MLSVRIVLVACFACLTCISPGLAQTGKPAPRDSGSPVATVDGQAIPRSELDRMFKVRRVDPELQPKVRAEFIDQLVDNRVLQRFLKAQKITVDEGELDKQVDQVKALLPKGATGSLDLQEYGYTDKVLREELALPLIWRNYVLKTVLEKDVQKYFEDHRIDLDGTQVKASQIFAKVGNLKDPEQVKQALDKLSKIRDEIKAGLPFADAAKKYSQAPSREKGGDVGFFLTEGKMPRAFTKVAFSLKPREMSEPFVSPFGAHLCLVTDRQEGELSLEDVRVKVMEKISAELMAKKLKELRSKAKIEKF